MVSTSLAMKEVVCDVLSLFVDAAEDSPETEHCNESSLVPSGHSAFRSPSLSRFFIFIGLAFHLFQAATESPLGFITSRLSMLERDADGDAYDDRGRTEDGDDDGTSTTACSPRYGLRLQRFQLRELLGMGRYGEVFRVVDLRDDPGTRRCQKALKVIQSASESMTTEISIQQSVNHPNLLGLLEVIQDDDSWCLLMRKLDGDLERLAGHVQEEAQLVDFARQIFSGVSWLHEHFIVHRDIKSTNIFFEKRGGSIFHLQIGDFGYATVFHPDDVFTESMGTPGFVAPELMSPRGYRAPKCDCWSSAIVLFHLFTGRLPEAEGCRPPLGGLPSFAKVILNPLLKVSPAHRASAEATVAALASTSAVLTGRGST